MRCSTGLCPEPQDFLRYSQRATLSSKIRATTGKSGYTVSIRSKSALKHDQRVEINNFHFLPALLHVADIIEDEHVEAVEFFAVEDAR